MNPSLGPGLLVLLLISLSSSRALAVQSDEDWRDHDWCASQRIEYGETIIGVDLGTVCSSVGVFKKGRVEIIPNDRGERIMPSYVAFTKNEYLIGDDAKDQAIINPENSIFDVKRLIGRHWNDEHVQADKKLLPFTIKEQNGKPVIEVKAFGKDKTFQPEEISAMVLGRMKEIAERYLGHPVSHAVVTVPAYFNDAQRQATKDAGVIAGLNVKRIINEPTAAAIAYGLGDEYDHYDEMNILVYHLGGGTFDVTLLEVDSGVFDVVSRSGDSHLGGNDFDERVAQYFLKLFTKKTGLDASKDKMAMQRLRHEVERVKRALSSAHKTSVEIDDFFEGEDFHATLTRARFEELNSDLFKKTITHVQQVLSDAKIQKSEVDEVVLVGGSTRIPKVQQLMKDFFNGKEPNRGINPEEAVVYGAAVYGGILADEPDGSESLYALHVAPLTLGLETVGGAMSPLIERNSMVPVKKTKMFSTHHDYQDRITIKVYEGERSMTKDNNLLGKFDLTGIPPAQRGVPQIEVTFTVDIDGILHVSAEDKGTGSVESISITKQSAFYNHMSPEEIYAKVEESERMKEVDDAMKEKVDSRNNHERYTYQIKSFSLRVGGKLTDEEKETIATAVTEADDWLDLNRD